VTLQGESAGDERHLYCACELTRLQSGRAQCRIRLA
jgi:hypothetical protein